MAGFQVTGQVFGVFPSSLLSSYPSLTCPFSATCNDISDGLLSSPVSGLMGLGWQPLSASDSVPFWQSLYKANALDEALMAFYLTRYGNQTNVQSLEPGGVFTLGLSKAVRRKRP